MIRTKTKRRYQFTPLRYPGGKTSLFQFFDEMILLNRWTNVQYIEPYAGGAGAALALLLLEKVDSIVINDLDRAIFAFWKTALEHTDDFIKKIDHTDVTVDEWLNQKEIYKNKRSADLFELGFAAFFINRTNRSGVMNAGPIGGLDQTGNYKIGARYNKESLMTKIKLIGLYKNRITVSNDDGLYVINKYAKNPNSFFYIDPPYYKQGKGLYMNFLDDQQHQVLASTLKKYRHTKWILTYDNEPTILQMYSEFEGQRTTFPLRYSANGSSIAREVMIFSDKISPA
jgi:DNA adenine methylase